MPRRPKLRLRLPRVPIRDNAAAALMFIVAVALSVLIIRVAPIVSSRLGAADMAVSAQYVKVLSCGATTTSNGMVQVYALVYNNGTSTAEVTGAYLYDSSGFEDASNSTEIYVAPRTYRPVTMVVMALNPYETYTVTVFTASGFSTSCMFTYSS